MAKAFTNEVKTGFFVLLCVAILAAFTISVGKLALFDEQYNIKTAFGKVAGIENDATVRLSGVEVGKVESVQLVYGKDGDTKVLLTLLIDNKARLREGAKATITTLGLMGEQYIELTPGNKGEPFIEAGSTITGEDPIDINDVIGEAKSTMNNISNLAKNLNEAVADNRPDIDEIMANLRRTTENFEEFSDDIKRNPWKLLVKGKEK